MSQLNYNVDADVGFAGQLADLEHGYKLTRVNDSGVAVPYGIAVAQSADGKSFDLVTDEETPYFGVLVHSHRADNRNLLGSASVDDGDLCDVLVRGSINVQVESDVDCDDVVAVRIASAGVSNKQIGALSAGIVEEVETNFRRLGGARWLSAASAGQVATVYFDLAVAEAMSDRDEEPEVPEVLSFVSGVTDATGTEQLIAHGMDDAPSSVLVVVVAGHDGAGAAGDKFPTVTEGAHDGTNVSVTASAGSKFRVFAQV